MTNEPSSDEPTAPRAPRRGVRAIQLIVWNLLFFFFLAEGVALVAYFAKTRTLFYTNPPVGKTIPRGQNQIQTYRIHPYFGFMIRPDAITGTDTSHQRETYNNHGFDSPFDFPVERRPGDLLVGVLGGSVASKLVGYDRREGVLTERLAAATGRSPEQVRVINLAQGGFKQPQQVQVLTFFQSLGQELDAVVNIDGFNDVALAARNQRQGIQPSMPSIEHVRALREVTRFQSSGDQLVQMQDVRSAFNTFADVYDRAWSGEAPETRLASGFLANLIYYKILERRFHTLRVQFESGPMASSADSWLYLETEPAPPSGPSEEPPPVEWPPILRVWSESAHMLQRIAESGDLLKLHVIQPNQYFETARVFSEAEQAVAFNPNSPYPHLVSEGYPLLLEEAERLTRDGIEVLELLELFDTLEAPAYEDDCCHYTDEGNRLLAERVADLLLERGLGSTSTEP